MTLDPSLTEFCKENSRMGKNGNPRWKNDCCALWRPGGCISTKHFLPKFYAYLEKIMGTYTDEEGNTRNRFSIKFEKEVTAVDFDKDANITGLAFKDGCSLLAADAQYVFCPGESIGTLRKFGFSEPAFTGFAGPSLVLTIPLTPELASTFSNFSHCMEVHKVGIVLAWQAKCKDNEILIGVAGTKAFYGDKQPFITEEFARNRHLVQLNMINDVLPQMVSLAFGHDTQKMPLSFEDLEALETNGILKRWVGRRAVADDGFPTLGALFHEGEQVPNARCTTHLGSGGVSFGPAAVCMSRRYNLPADEFTKTILQYADSRRQP